MKINQTATDDVVLAEIGRRLAALRLAANLTQAVLARQAGVGVRTVQRLETGAAATQLSGFVRVCRALGLAERLDALVPEAAPSPMAELAQRRRVRRRASSAAVAAAPTKWTWGDER